MSQMDSHGISHDRSEETPEAKAAWFASLSMAERARVFCEMTEMILAINPAIVEAREARPPARGVRVLELPRR